jgi:chemotaxis protein MotB
MKPKYLQAEGASRDRWMISYLDVLTILLIFFVAVGAQSLETAKIVGTAKTVETAKALEPAEPVQTPKASEISVPEPEPSPSQRAIQQKLEHYRLDWRADPRGLAITLPQAVLFPPGSAQVNAAALPMLGQIAEVLQEVPNKINLGGHADPVPIHNRLFKSNWELAAARSLSLLDLLTSRYGIAESRFSIASYSSNDPRTSNDTPDGRAGNRRVEILILDETPPLH